MREQLERGLKGIKIESVKVNVSADGSIAKIINTSGGNVIMSAGGSEVLPPNAYRKKIGNDWIARFWDGGYHNGYPSWTVGTYKKGNFKMTKA